MNLPTIRSRVAQRPTRTGDGAPRPPSVFISHATSDGADHAARLDRELRQHRVDTWLWARDMYEAVDFTSELEHAIDAADSVIACITSDALRPNSYVRREIAYAELCGKPIAVARFAAVRPPISVVTNTFFEFHQDWEAAFRRLLAFCRSREGTLARER